MMDKSLTQHDLERTLIAVGFREEHTGGQHKVFRHQPTGTVFLLPLNGADTPLNPLHLVAARKLAVERGVVEANVFDHLLEVARAVETAAASD